MIENVNDCHEQAQPDMIALQVHIIFIIANIEPCYNKIQFSDILLNKTIRLSDMHMHQ